MKRMFAGFAACFMVTACQSSVHQLPVTGSLNFRLMWPSFQTQLIRPETTRVLLALYDGDINQGQSPLSHTLTRSNDRLVVEKLRIGEKFVIALAVDSNNTILTGDAKKVTILGNQRQQLVLDLQADPLAKLTAAQRDVLNAWLKQQQTDPEIPADTSTNRDGTTGNVVPVPTPTPKSIPTPEPVISVGAGGTNVSASPTPEATPVPTPTSTPFQTGSRSSGGGGSSTPVEPTPTPTPSPSEVNIGEEGASIPSEITVTDGAPRPVPIIIE